MTEHIINPFIKSGILPFDIVFHPSWWHKHAGIIFDEDFFYHPLKRVETEKQMEYELYERFGRYGLGKDMGKEKNKIKKKKEKNKKKKKKKN